MIDPAFAEHDRLYTRRFFEVFAAVALFMTGVALQFHFGQYIAYLGHGVDTLGKILGAGMVGTLLIRLHIGRWIDRFGCRPTWLIGSVIVAAALIALPFTDSVWLITGLRALSAMALSAVMTTVAVFAAMVAPPHRRAESIGTMGLAGFLGMIAGPALGDWIFSGDTASATPYYVFFGGSALFSLLSGGVMLFVSIPMVGGATKLRATKEGARRSDEATEGWESDEATKRRSDGGVGRAEADLASSTSQLRVIAGHWPGMILLIGVVFGVAFCWQSQFLERFAEARGFRDIKVFFAVYGPTAIVLRIVFRRMPQQLGRTRTVAAGMVFLAAGQLVLTAAHSEAGLVIPALLMGTGHCFIFPSMVDLGAERLPLGYRGTGTALILGAGDVGMIIGFVGLGEVVETFGFNTALHALAVTVLAAALLFAFARRHAVLRPGTRY